MSTPQEREGGPAPFTPHTPLMQQYFGARSEHPGVVLLMRVGDFYEAYGDDAVTIADVLNITLTGRDDGGQRVPMAGVPHHAAERYVVRLIRAGLRVAIMEQVEDPKLAKGLVKRRVTRVVSRGTVFEDALLESKSNNYLVAAVVSDPVAGLGVVDVSTGEFLTTELDGDTRAARLIEEICRLEPAEVLVPAGADELAELVRGAIGTQVTPFEARNTSSFRTAHDVLTSHFGTQSLRGFGCEDFTSGLDAAALIVDYLKETQTGALAHITGISTYSTREYMVLDAVARRNLELSSSLVDGGRSRTLLAVLDCTETAMGGRLMRKRLEEPLLDVAAINRRLDGVDEFTRSELARGDLREQLRGVNDIERLVARAAAGLANARDLVGLKESLARIAPIGTLLAGAKSDIVREHARILRGETAPSVPLLVSDVRSGSGPVHDVLMLIEQALVDDPPAGLRDGGLIRTGHAPELDALRSSAADGRAWIAELETRERERTGIGSLKVGYNAVFGYYIEVTKANLARVPAEYIRKQTTAGGERYITPDLKEYEAKVLGADEKALDLEYRLFTALRDRVVETSAELLIVARAIAELDVLSAFAETAVKSRYVRPTVDDGDSILITGGRHPVVEKLHAGLAFVPNDCVLDCGEHQVHIITGPNMSGKSTVLRQVALITLLAQVGSFVPADEAAVGVVDRIFTRVGAHDELASGQSTFMVEMNETASILNNATPKSLVVLDEIGRGTSTYDGLSIAWAVSEHLTRVGCKTLFATHYHHLNDLAKHFPCVRNFRVAVREQGDRIIWLHKLVPGGTDRSYGIQVARMAGVPPEVIARAKEVLAALEKSGPRGSADLVGKANGVPATKRKLQLTLFEAEAHPVVTELASLDLATLTPIEALIKLDELQRIAREHTG